MGVPPSSLQRELQELVKAGILKTRRQGRMAYHQANSESPLFPELRGLLLKTTGLVDVLADVLKPLTKKLSVVFIYGSIASGNEQSDSDIDLMVVGAVSPPDLALPLRRARETTRPRRQSHRLHSSGIRQKECREGSFSDACSRSTQIVRIGQQR